MSLFCYDTRTERKCRQCPLPTTTRTPSAAAWGTAPCGRCQTWEETYAGLALEGFLRGDLPNADSVWGPYLRRHGFTRYLLPDACPDCYTVADFAADHPHGTFILSMPERHVLCVQDGQGHDSWDNGMEVPAYYWTKEN